VLGLGIIDVRPLALHYLVKAKWRRICSSKIQVQFQCFARYYVPNERTSVKTSKPTILKILLASTLPTRFFNRPILF
jgi:hypothetical protein